MLLAGDLRNKLASNLLPQRDKYEEKGKRVRIKNQGLSLFDSLILYFLAYIHIILISYSFFFFFLIFLATLPKYIP